MIRITPSARASNNACGAFFISVIMFVVVLALDHVDPRPGTGVLLGLVSVVGLVALAFWWWVAYRVVTHTTT
jgi:hypothetical protein